MKRSGLGRIGEETNQRDSNQGKLKSFSYIEKSGCRIPLEK